MAHIFRAARKFFFTTCAVGLLVSVSNNPYPFGWGQVCCVRCLVGRFRHELLLIVCCHCVRRIRKHHYTSAGIASSRCEGLSPFCWPQGVCLYVSRGPRSSKTHNCDEGLPARVSLFSLVFAQIFSSDAVPDVLASSPVCFAVSFLVISVNGCCSRVA